MAKEIFKNLPSTSTPLSASKLNGLFDGGESMGSIVVEDIKCKNLYIGGLKELSFAPLINLSKGTYTINEIGTTSGNWYFKAYKNGEVLNSGVTFNKTFSWSDGSKCWYRADATLQGFTFILSEDCTVQIGRLNADGSQKVQLEPGSVATNYVPHKSFENKGVVYDDEERVIGTWWGQLLYRKVIEFGTLPNNGTKNVSHYISNVHYFTKIRGFAYQTNGTYNVPIPFKEGNVEISISANDVNTFIKTFDDRTGWYAFVILEYIKDN